MDTVPSVCFILVVLVCGLWVLFWRDIVMFFTVPVSSHCQQTLANTVNSRLSGSSGLVTCDEPSACWGQPSSHLCFLKLTCHRC